jgi:cell division protein FtsB
MTIDMLFAWVAPLALLGGVVWRASAKLTLLEHSIKQLEKDNRELRAEIRALERLIKMFVER